jgi:hypothetical protein
MLVDLVSNSTHILKYVRKKQGGRLSEEGLVNIPIGYLNNFARDLWTYVNKNKINLRKKGYKIIAINGKEIIRGKL